MKTRRLYHEEPDTLRFEARVVSRREHPEGGTLVELDRTAFYPTGGGQPHDLGRLAGLEVVDVLEEEGMVLHHLRGELPGDLPGDTVTGEVDVARRLDHCQQHSGQHILSRAFEELGARTVGFHLGNDRCTIDLVGTEVDEVLLARVEKRVDEVVLSNADISTSLHEDPSTVPEGLRNDLPPERPIRLVEMGEFDRNPCCGTHCSRTGQVGPIRVLRTERNKGGTRVEFVCGDRALADHSRRVRLLRELALELTTEEGDLPDRIRALRGEAKRARGALEKAEGELRERVQGEWVREAEGEMFFHGEVDAARGSWLAPLASGVASEAGVECLVSATHPEGVDVALGSPPGKEPGAGDRLGTALKAVDGRGGGSSSLARGRVPAGRMNEFLAALGLPGGV